MKKKELLKRIEALEKKVADLLTMQAIESMVSITNSIADWADKIQPKPSFQKGGVSKTDKFKAIADHANAINDIIKNAPE
jgi:hypothetical protein